jgi:hypothetical protein
VGQSKCRDYESGKLETMNTKRGVIRKHKEIGSSEGILELRRVSRELLKRLKFNTDKCVFAGFEVYLET